METRYTIIWNTGRKSSFVIPANSRHSFKYLFEEKFGAGAMRRVRKILKNP